MKEHQKDIILSICIPTLGGSARLEEGLHRILNYKNNDIEIIISDNDNTGKIQKILDRFCDERLHYYSNGMNRGAVYNWIKVLTYGKGKYLFTLNDIDWIVEENLLKLIDFLKKEEASVIVNTSWLNGTITYTEGAKNGYSATGVITHPSYYIIKREYFCKIENKVYLENKMRKVPYVHCALALICSRHNRICINSKINLIEVPDENYYILNPSRTTKKGQYTYYTPIGALKMLENYISICTKYYSPAEVRKMVPYLYKAQLKRATVEYKSCSISRKITMRYGLPYREDININKERKQFYKQAVNLLRKKYRKDVLIGVWIITVLDKWKAYIINIEEGIQYLINKYKWAKKIQKCWRIIRKRNVE